MKRLYDYILENKNLNVVYNFSLDGEKLCVADIYNYNNSGKVARAIKNDDIMYSIIWKDASNINQPAYPEIQQAIESNVDDLSNALVLGGGGCAIPRYLLLKYKDVNVTSVELSDELIKIANDYFLNDLAPNDLSRHTIKNDDAIKFVNDEPNNKYDLVFVDLFNGDKIIKSIFSEDFIENIKRITTDDALIIYNVSMVEEQDIIEKIGDKFEDYFMEFNTTDSYNYIVIKK